jgi:hypothetical protein
LRGSSAIEQLLEQHSDQNLRVLVIWEPVLVTDWSPPSRSTLARISDRRARQFWDPKHLVSSDLIRNAKHSLGQPEPVCCFDHGIHWDEVILFAPHTEWKSMPPAIFWNGPVARVIPGLEKALHDSPP